MLDLDFWAKMLEPFVDYNEGSKSLVSDIESNPYFKKLQKKLDTLGCPYKHIEKDGVCTVEAVVAGHNPNNIKVKWNENEHILKIVDEVKVDNTPWYYENLDLMFHLPETTDKETFVKKIENGVLTVSVRYEPDDDTKAMPATEIEIR